MIFYVTPVRPELALVQVFVKPGHHVQLEHVLVSEPELCNHLRLLAALGAPEAPFVRGTADLDGHPPRVFFDLGTSPQNLLHHPLTARSNTEFARPLLASSELTRRVAAGQSIGGLVFHAATARTEPFTQTSYWGLKTTEGFPSCLVYNARTQSSLAAASGRHAPAGGGFKSLNLCTMHSFVASLAQHTAAYLNNTGVTEQ